MCVYVLSHFRHPSAERFINKRIGKDVLKAASKVIHEVLVDPLNKNMIGAFKKRR